MKYKSKLANAILEEITKINFGENRFALPVISQEIIDILKENKLHLDYRTHIQGDSEFASVFEGLSFDNNLVTSQSFVIYEKENPIGVISIIIVPKSFVAKQRYLKKEKEGIKIIDISEVINNDTLPSFLVIPAWTNIIKTHRNKLAIPGFKAFKNIINKIIELAPPNTYIEMTAQGASERAKGKEIEKFVINNIKDVLISNENLPFDINLIGVNSDGSSSTVKIASILGFTRIENIGANKTLGPVFIKKVN